MRRVSEGAKVPGLGRCPDLGGPDKGGLSVQVYTETRWRQPVNRDGVHVM